jgi:DNA-binding response OmpR family regulator
MTDPLEHLVERVRETTILVVDDVQDNLDLVVESLADEPWQVVTARSAQEAWTLIEARVPDLILLDVQMPEINGFQLCDAVRNTPGLRGEIPIIFLTAERCGTANVVCGLELGADDYICKPFARDELRARVRAALRRCRR